MTRDEFLNLKPTQMSKKIAPEYYKDVSFNSEENLIEKHLKIQMLNGIKLRVEELQRETEDTIILDTLEVHLLVIEDCYNIDMYKFQFKHLMNIMNKELDNIKELILLESS